LLKVLARSWFSSLIASLSCLHQSSKSSFDHECLKPGCLMKSPREHLSVMILTCQNIFIMVTTY
jgi:hypothetical protein